MRLAVVSRASPSLRSTYSNPLRFPVPVQWRSPRRTRRILQNRLRLRAPRNSKPQALGGRTVRSAMSTRTRGIL